MATIKIKFRASSSTENEGTLFYRVTHNRIVRQISSGYKVFPQEWNADFQYKLFGTKCIMLCQRCQHENMCRYFFESYRKS